MFRFRLSTLLFAVFLAALITPVILNYIGNRPLGLEPYSSISLANHMSDGRRVLVVFDADWDLRTKYALNGPTSNVRGFVRKNGIVAMRADWTKHSVPVTKLMAQLGITSLPAFAIFSPNDTNNPKVVKDLVSESELLAVLNDLRRR